MHASSRQLSVGRSQSWDTFGGNEGRGDGESSYEHSGRIPGRRNSLTYGGDGGGWYEPPPGVRPPDLDLKREPCSYQGFPDRFEQRPLRKNSVPELNSHYDRQAMASRNSLPPLDYNQHDPALGTRQLEDPRACYRGELQPLSRSAPHYGVVSGARSSWDQGLGRPPSTACPFPPPVAHEMSRIYKDPTTGKMMPDGQRIPGRNASPGRYGLEATSPRYATEPLPSVRSIYSDLNGCPLVPRQISATCLMVDPTSQGMDGTVNRGMVQHQESPSTFISMAAQKIPYDPGFDPNAPVAAAGNTPICALPQPQTPVVGAPAMMDPRKNVDPEFLAFLRREGISESAIALLLQQGFDSPSMLAVMEENDIRSVAPNLGQARVLSRIALSCKRPPLEATMNSVQGVVRARSNSFSHHNDVYLQQQSLDPSVMPLPTNTLQPISGRMGEMMGRRPNSAPSQHLLETTSYPGPSPGCYPNGTGGSPNAMPQTRSISVYAGQPAAAVSALTPMNAVPPQPLAAASAAPPKVYSTTYTVPMELMKRDRTMLPMSTLQNLQPSPQMMRKVGSQAENSLLAAGTNLQTQSTGIPNQKLSRRTGPPVIVSTMASPDSSNPIYSSSSSYSSLWQWSSYYLFCVNVSSCLVVLFLSLCLRPNAKTLELNGCI